MLINYLKSFIYLIILLTLPINLLANNINSGYILEYGNREPISFATVKIIDSKNVELENYTDKNGFFIFKNLKLQNYSLIIDDINDFKGKELKISFKDSNKIEKTIFLEKVLNSNYMLNIKKKKNKDENKHVLDKSDFDKVAGTNNNFIEVIKKLPGVSRNSSINSNGLVIRGTGSLNSRIFIGGHYTPILYHFSGITPIFNSELIESIEFYPGNFSVKYGKASGGIVDIKIRDANTLKKTKKIHGYIDLNVVDSSILLEYPINEKSGIALTFKKSFIDITYPLIIRNSDISRRLPVYYDWQLRYNYAFSRKNKISFTHFGSNDKYEFIDSDSSKVLNYDDYSAKSFLVVNIFDWYYKINKKVISNLSLSFQYNNRSFKVGEFIKVKNIPYLGILKEDLTFKLSKFFKLNIGLENWAGLIYTYAEVPASVLKSYSNQEALGDYKTTNYFMEKKYYLSAVYNELVFEINSFNMSLGLRGEYSSLNHSFSLDPRFNAFYKFNKHFLIKTGVGVFHQPPFEYQTDKTFGNPDLKNQYAIQYIMGLKYESKLFSSGIDIFYNSQKNLITRNSENNYNNDGEGKAYGLEFLFKYSFKNSLRGWISYTLMKSQYRENSADKWLLFDYDQTHILNLVTSYKIFSNINLSLTVSYNTGSPYTPIVTSFLDSDKNKYIPIYGEKNSERLKDFFKLNFRIDKEFILKYWKYTIYLDIQNITNNLNEEGKAYNHDYTEYLIVQGIPFFPSLGIKGEF